MFQKSEMHAAASSGKRKRDNVLNEQPVMKDGSGNEQGSDSGDDIAERESKRKKKDRQSLGINFGNDFMHLLSSREDLLLMNRYG